MSLFRALEWAPSQSYRKAGECQILGSLHALRKAWDLKVNFCVCISTGVVLAYAIPRQCNVNLPSSPHNKVEMPLISYPERQEYFMRAPHVYGPVNGERIPFSISPGSSHVTTVNIRT